MKHFGLALKLAILAFVLIGVLDRDLYSQSPRADDRRSSPGTIIPGPPAESHLKEAYTHLPLSFEANRGQTDDQVQFFARADSYTLFLTRTEAVLSLQRNGQKSTVRKPNPVALPLEVLHLRLVGSDARARAVGLDALPRKSNYFTGNDPAKWRTNVPNYARVEYEGVYPGIDLAYYGKQGQLEYDFIVAPGADPNSIRLSFDGGTGAHLDARSGDLVIKFSGSEVRFRKPVIYQPASTNVLRSGRDATSHSVRGSYVLNARNQVTFELASYDHSKPLVIDPAIVYSTYLGGAIGDSSATGVAVFTDPVTGHVYAYVVGSTSATDFPVVNALQSFLGGSSGNAFITKFDPSATGAASVVWSTYLGGSGGDDAIGGIAVDSAGNAFVTGQTHSTDFPTVNAYQTSSNYIFNNGNCGLCSGNTFVTKVSADGLRLMYSSYFGGSGGETANAIALDSAGRAFIAGVTNSHDLRMVNSYQTSFPNLTGNSAHGTAFVAGFDTTKAGQGSLIYSTYLGNATGAYALAVDGTGALHVGGLFRVAFGDTITADFPIVSGFQAAPLGGGFGAAIYAKLNPHNSGAAQLVYSTYLGDYNDVVQGLALDSGGNVYLSWHAVTKINPSLVGSASLIYSTPLAGLEGRSGIVLDANGDAFVVASAGPGQTLVNPIQYSSTGVFQSLNAGATWTGLTQGLSGFPILSLAIDASTSPRTLYVGNGIGTIFTSTDGGLNWNRVLQLSTVPVSPCHGNNPGPPCVFALAIDPTTPSNVYASTDAGVYRSTDRGAIWSALNTGLSTTAVQGIGALVFDGGTLYAGAADGLYKLSPGATTWTHTSQTAAVQYVAVDPTTTPHTLYTGSDGIAGPGAQGLYKSIDGGSTWISIQPNGWSPVSSIAVDTTSTPTTLYGYDDADAELLKSTDSGNTWKPILACCAGGYTPGAIGLDTSTSPTVIYLMDGEFLDKSTDGGVTWSQIWFGRPIAAAIALDPTTAGPTSPQTLYIANSDVELDAFVAELNPAGSALLFSTYLSGVEGSTFGNAIALDGAGNIYVAGYTTSRYLPTPNAYQAALAFQQNTPLGQSGHTQNAFLAKLGNQTLPQSSSGSVSSQVAVQTGTLSITFPNINGSTTSTPPTLTVTPLSSTTTANFSLSSNLGAYDISTTATFSASSSNPVTLCFQTLTVNDPGTFSNLQILHVVNGVAQNVTTSYNFNTRTICGAVTSFSPFVLVKGVTRQIDELIRTVNESNLRHGIQTSLDAKLQNAVSAFSAARNNSYTTVCNQMSAFINNVQAQSGQSITPAESGAFISAAKQIKATLGCTP